MKLATMSNMQAHGLIAAEYDASTDSGEAYAVIDNVKHYITGGDQCNLKIVAGAIRNTGTGWAFINDENHKPIGVSGVSVNENGSIVISYEEPATKVATFGIFPDETFAKLYSCGASVGLSTAVVNVYNKSQTIGGLVRWNNNQVNKTYSSFSTASFDSNTHNWTVTHPTVYPISTSSDLFKISAVGSGAGYPVIQSVGDGSIVYKLFKPDGTEYTEPVENVGAYITRQTGDSFVKANDIVSANGNFWFIGLLEV